MSRKALFLCLVAMVITQPVLADDDYNDAACDTMVKACLTAGYSRDEGADKKLWSDCMNPLLLNETVDRVTANEAAIKMCRASRIDQMTKKLEMLKKANQ